MVSLQRSCLAQHSQISCLTIFSVLRSTGFFQRTKSEKGQLLNVAPSLSYKPYLFLMAFLSINFTSGPGGGGGCHLSVDYSDLVGWLCLQATIHVPKSVV